MITNNKKERITCQRKIILDYLKSVKIHPCAEEVYSAVKKRLPHISLGTVYRNLKFLKEKGDIQEIPCRTCEVSHYDGDISPHGHFICQKCRRIFDVFEKEDSLKNKKLKVGKVNNYQIYFYGTCKKCSQK